MSKSSLLVLLLIFAVLAGCSDDDPVTPPPSTGEVLLAEISGDSVGTASGISSRTMSITSSTLNFTDRDSARITFFYSGENNSAPEPFVITYSDSLILFNFLSLNPTPAEQFMEVTFASPRVSSFCKYKISTSSSPGFSYFKFRDLKIYKK